MSTIAAVSAKHGATSANSINLLRRAAMLAAGVAALLSTAQISQAQTLVPDKKWELRVSSGAFVPAGNQRNFLKDAQVTAAQISWLARPKLAVTGTVTWARSRDIGSVDNPKLDVFTSDVGVEARPVQWHANRTISFSPFVGAGGGARSYNYRKLDVDASNNLAGYAGVGGELGIRRVAVRLEVRDYATGLKPLISGGKSDTRNDVVIMAAVRFNRRVSQQ